MLGYEAEALAIYDLMRFVKPPISTLCVGNAFGEAAMLLASGQKVRTRPLLLFPSEALYEAMSACACLKAHILLRLRVLSAGKEGCLAVHNHHAQTAHVQDVPDAGHRHRHPAHASPQDQATSGGSSHSHGAPCEASGELRSMGKNFRL